MLGLNRTTGSTRRTVALAVAAGLALGGASGAPLRAAGDAFCAKYANQALEQFRSATELGCDGLVYPAWSMDFDHHYNWCRSVSESDALAGGKQRTDEIAACKASRRETSGTIVNVATPADPGQIAGSARQYACASYAQTAIAQQSRNEEMNCGLTGPEWNPDYDAHYSWCMGLGDTAPAQAGQRARQDALDRCAAGQGGGNYATPIQIPGQMAKSRVGSGAPSIPTPSPTLDPGLGGQPPANIDLQNMARQAVLAPSRQSMITALMADPVMRARLQALPNLPGGVQDLSHQTLSGGTVTAHASPAGSPAQSAAAYGGMSPSSGPVLPQGADWHAGIHFSPFVPAPTYFLGGRGMPLATSRVSGAVVSNDTIGPMNQGKVVFLGKTSTVQLGIDLPNESATYLVAFGLSGHNYTPAPPDYQGADAAIQAVAFDHRRNALTPLNLTPLSGGRGFVAMLEVKLDPDPALRVTNRLVVLTVDGVKEGSFAFGGITMTRL